MLLKRAQVESMKNEIDKLSLQRTKRNSFGTDGRDKGGQDNHARRREMLKVVVSDTLTMR